LTGEKDKQLLEALTQAYTARALLFHEGVRTNGIDLLIAEIDQIDHRGFDWDLKKLGISPKSFARVKTAGGLPHQVFTHPGIIRLRPHLVAYYRNMVAISRKGIAQILFPSDRFESRRASEMTEQEALQVSITFNRIISGVIDSIQDYTPQLSRQVILAEIGTELQGTWANTVGQGAAKKVEELFADYICNKGLGEHEKAGLYRLKNGWSLRFAAEPDAAFLDPQGETWIAIEIKGSLDLAGAQTRYGETKKTFAKMHAKNPRCHTIYLASCFTKAVIDQIEMDGQVRKWFNLTSILYDPLDRSEFLEHVFYHVNAPQSRRRSR